MMSQILLIGGTDPSGAGLQTDLKVAHHLQCPTSSVITAVTAQNASGVQENGVLHAEHVKAQLDSLENQHFSAIKIGMLGNESIISVVIDYLQAFSPNQKPFVILDPVITSSSKGKLLNSAGIESLKAKLLPLVDLITPNTDELSLLTDNSINDFEQLESACHSLLQQGAKAVFAKGGHFTNKKYSIDYFIDPHESFYLQGQRWEDKSNVRGTGCALATTIACKRHQQFALNDSVVFAKAFISNGIRHAQYINEQHILHFAKHGVPHPFDLMDYPKLFKNIETLNTHLENKQTPFERCDSHMLGIYPVVDSLDWIKKLVPLGIKTIQLRIKDQKDEDVEEEIKQTIEYAKQHEVRLFINDYWRVAIKHQAYGIHLGQEDLDDADMQAIAESGCHLGVSTHSYTEVARAYGLNPSYLALGPIYATTSKDMPWIPQGVQAVQNWFDLLGSEYPLVAIGGINHQRASNLKPTKVGSVAMISAITQADDYKKATHDLIELWDR